MKHLTRMLAVLLAVGVAAGLLAAVSAGVAAAGTDGAVTIGENETVPNESTEAGSTGDSANETETNESATSSESNDSDRLVWEFDEPDAEVVPSPTVSEGFVYVSSLDGNVYSIDSSNGTKEWSVPAGRDISVSSPTVDDGTVYVGSRDNHFPDGAVQALNASTGVELWNTTALGRVDGSPIVANDTVYVASMDRSSNASAIRALNESNGEELWNVSVPDYALTTSPVLQDGTLYVSGSHFQNSSPFDIRIGSGKVLAIDIENRSIDWQFTESGGQIQSAPSVSEGTVYVSSGAGAVHALDATDGNLTATFETTLPVRASPTIVDGTIYAGTFGNVTDEDEAGVYAIDETTGEELWSTNVTAAVSASIAVDGETLFVGDESGTLNDSDPYEIGGTLYALNATSGETQWSFDGADRYIRSAPTVSSGTVYFGNHDSNVYAVNAASETSDDGDSSDEDEADEDDGGSSGPIAIGPGPDDDDQDDDDGDSDGAAEFDVTLDAESETALPGESVAIDVTVENVGDASGTVNLDVQVDGDVEETVSVTLEEGEQTTKTAFPSLPEDESDVEIVARSSDGVVQDSLAIAVEAGDDDGNATDGSEVVDDADDDSDGTPGFGIAAALLGLVLTSLAVSRRRP